MLESQDLFATLQQELLACLGTLKTNSSGWHIQNCKLCQHRGHGHDRRRRFGIKFEGNTIGVHCFNCGFSSKWEPGDSFSRSFTWFLNHIGMPTKTVKVLQFEAYRYRHNNTKHVFKIEERQQDPRDKWHIITLPEGAKTFEQLAEEGCDHPRFLDAVMYLDSRKLLYPRDFYWTPKQKDRIIIPARYKKQIVSWTGRFIGTPPNKQTPRYILEKPEHFLYNLDNQYNKDVVIVAEGVLDAYLLDCISPFGNSMTDEQVAIVNSFEKPVILLPDRDQEGEELVNVALKNNWQVSIPKWHKGIKDFSDATLKYGRLLAARTVIEGATTGFDAQLKRKMDKLK
jgi:hypothetical protein